MLSTLSLALGYFVTPFLHQTNIAGTHEELKSKQQSYKASTWK